MPKIPFVGTPAESRSKEQNNQKLRNWFVVADAFDGKRNFILHPTPGLLAFANLSASETRALLEHKGVLYAVGDNKLYSIDSSGVKSLLGSLLSSSGRVSIAAIDDELLLVDGTNGYIYGVTSTAFTKITDVDFPTSPEVCTAQDGYFIVPAPNSDQFYVSAINDGSTWSALDFASAEGGPDLLTTARSYKRELWLFGERNTEVWLNTGASFPFERIQSVFIPFGCSAKHSVAAVDNTLFWLGQSANGDSIVLKNDGFNARVISTPGISFKIGQYTTISDAFGYGYGLEGNEFYVLTFPSEAATWVYNTRTQLWHEWTSYNSVTLDQDRHQSNAHAHVYGKNLVADYRSGNIYELNPSTYTDDGVTITRKRVTAPLHADDKLLTLHRLDVDFESGVGLQTGQGSAPLAQLRVSRDGGHTWGNRLDRSPGVVGNHEDRTSWVRLGTGRSFVFELTCTDPVKWIVIGANAQITGLPAGRPEEGGG